MATPRSAMAELTCEMSSMGVESPKTPTSINANATSASYPEIEALAPNGIDSNNEGKETIIELCHNFNILDGACMKQASIYCSTCHLTQYCSKNCMKSHLKEHNMDCKANSSKVDWLATFAKEGRDFVESEESREYAKHKYFWGDTPQYDILKLADNEGLDYEKDLELCFAASGDLRNVIETVNNIPQTLTFTRTVNIIVNDSDIDITLRNAVQLLLAFLYPNGEVGEMFIHLWYSGSITSAMNKVLSGKVAPIIKTFCAKLESKSDGSIFSTKWEFGRSSFRLALKKKEWMRLLSLLEPKNPLEFAAAEKRRKAAMIDFKDQAEKDKHERSMYYTPRFIRVVDLRHRRTGVFLPFGCQALTFDTPNPFFYDQDNKWLPYIVQCEGQSVGCNPQKLSDTMKSSRLPKNDIHGGVFLERRAEIRTFCKRLAEIKTEICMYNVDAKILARTMAAASYHRKGMRFDRIDASNLADPGYLGIGPTLIAMAPLLKNQKENLYATLLTSFVHALRSMCATETTQKTKDLLVRLLPEPLGKCWCHANNSELQRLKKTAEKFEDFEKLWQRYTYRRNFTLNDTTGLREKDEHTIIKKWPWKINPNAKFKDVKKQFEMFRGPWGGERFVEWRVDEMFVDTAHSVVIRKNTDLWNVNRCERAQPCCGCCPKCEAKGAGERKAAGGSAKKGRK